MLNCLLREVAEPLPGAARPDGPRTYRLPHTRRLLRVRGARRPTAPEVHTAGSWRLLTHTELVKLVAEELRRHTGRSNHELPAEMLDSRDAVAALLAARDQAAPPDDPYRRSESPCSPATPTTPPPRPAAAAPRPPGCRTRPRRTPASR
ncbi:Siderophore synthetase component OS=Streptomyces albaduncus OX=68172 GN=FHS32_001223 PE=3 SV=1 [Streptomyces griseoloalbus]